VSENENRKQELEHFTAVGEGGSGREENCNMTALIKMFVAY